MMIYTILAVLVIASALFLAIRYIVKEKKKGSKCIGCPYADGCCKGGCETPSSK